MAIEINSNNRVSLGAGENLVLELQLVSGSVVDDLAGRSFALTVFDAERTVLDGATGSIEIDDEGSYAAFGVPGTTTDGWYGQTGLRYEIAEILANGRDIIVTGTLVVRASAETVSGSASVVDGPAARFTATDLQGNRRIVVSQRGAPGVPNSLSIGTVTSSAPGGAGSATITGNAPTQTLNLTLPRGPIGPANVLSIGTVTASDPGSAAAASITGDAPTQTLNLTLPRGATGPANSLSIGTVTTGALGGAAGATITGTAPTQTLNLTLPRGDVTPEALAARTDAVNAAAAAATSAAGLASILVNESLDPRQRVDFVDSQGNIFYTVQDGDLTPSELNAATAAAQVAVGSDLLDIPSIEIVDRSDNLIGRITSADIEHPKIDAIDAGIDAAKVRGWAAAVRAAGPTSSAHRLRTAVSHIIKYGQSNSINTSDTPGYAAYVAPLTMFNGGVHTRRGFGATDTTALTGANRTSFVTMQETGSETGMAAALSMMLKLALAWGADLSSSNLRLLGSSAGVGGVSIEQLRSTYYFRVTEDITEAKAIADAAKNSYGVSALLYNGNESNQLNTAPVGGSSVATTIANFLAQLRQMQVDVQTSAQTISGQTWAVPMFIVQTNTHLSTASASYTNANALVARAQVQAGQNVGNVNDNIVFCGPSYQFPLDSAANTVHFSMVGGAVRDALIGVAMFKLFFLGVKQQPLIPVITRNGNFLRLVFPIDPGRSLRFDTDAVPAQTNFGFRVFNAADVAQTIDAVRIIAHDTVEIACAATPAAGWTVDYAIATSTGGTRGLGNLRDNQGDDIIVDRFDWPLHNWIPLFKETVA